MEMLLFNLYSVEQVSNSYSKAVNTTALYTLHLTLAGKCLFCYNRFWSLLNAVLAFSILCRSFFSISVLLETMLLKYLNSVH